MKDAVGGTGAEEGFVEVDTFEFSDFAARKVLRFSQEAQRQKTLQSRIQRDNLVRAGKQPGVSPGVESP